MTNRETVEFILHTDDDIDRMVQHRHPGTIHVARFFKYEHLPEGELRNTSQLCCMTALHLIHWLPDGPELTAGLRKLLEAKDCFVRAAL